MTQAINHSKKLTQMHVKTRLQIDVLQKTVISHCECDQDKQVIRELITRLKNHQSGSVSKGELARQYGISPVTLYRRIRSADGLLSELFDDFNYNKWRKYLLPNEIECIYKYLGIPPVKI
jgi:hypothetical protein